MNGMQPVVNCKPCCCFIFLFGYYVTDPVSPWLVAVAKNWHGRLFNEPALQLMQLLNLNASSKPTQVQEIICLFVCLFCLISGKNVLCHALLAAFPVSLYQQIMLI
jgi:hypothetical protein